LGLAVGLVLLVALLWLPLAPYYGAYFNPLVGGGPVAERTFAFGQGEGLDLAAEYLNTLPGGQDLLAVTFYPPQFRYYFEGDATSLRRGDWDGTWQFAEYVVFYVSQVQRQLPSAGLVEFFLAQQPEYVAELGGVDFARVYRSPLLLSGEPSWAERVLGSRVVDGRLALTGYALSTPFPTPGETWYVTLSWQALEQLGRDYHFEARLVDDAGQVAWQAAGPPFDGQFPTWWWRPGRALHLRYAVPPRCPRLCRRATTGCWPGSMTPRRARRCQRPWGGPRAGRATWTSSTSRCTHDLGDVEQIDNLLYIPLGAFTAASTPGCAPSCRLNRR